MPISWTPFFRKDLANILDELKTYIEMETPSHNKEAVDRLGAFIQNRFSSLGCRVSTIPQTEYGNQIRCEFGQGEKQILILGHFDTVKEMGTLAQEPWRIEERKGYGPGIYDMKAGIVMGYFALKAIVEHGLSLDKKLVFFWNTDEEVGSPSSERLIEEEAKKSEIALVLEPAYGGGLLKTSRKGGGEFLLQVYGRAAHAGNDHAQGINAIEELAHHIQTIQSWTNYEAGTTLSVGTIKGGTAVNVVPAYAEASIDVRVSKRGEAAAITRKMNSLTPKLPGAKISVHGGISKPPMERTIDTEKLYHHALQQAKVEGFELGEIGVGGTSDGNTTSSVGTPTLDGLGPVGGGAHAEDEHIMIDELPRRIALLLRLFTTL